MDSGRDRASVTGATQARPVETAPDDGIATGDRRGILYPARLPTFHRAVAPTDLQQLVRWFWIPRWRLAPGRSSRQEVLPFPASNLVVEPDGVSLSGPGTRASHRDLSGHGWAVGALLRPAAIGTLGIDPGRICDAEVPYDAPGLWAEIVEAMSEPDEDAGRLEAVDLFIDWFRSQLEPPGEQALLANAMEDLIASDRTVVKVDHVAARLALSVRSVQRLAKKFIGLGPLAVIRRYRLQEAAQLLRTDPSVTVAKVAADLGYSDHAHLSADFRNVLGFSPQSYRQSHKEGSPKN